MLALILLATLGRTVAQPIPTDASRAETLQTIGLEKARTLESEACRKTAIVLMGQSVEPTGSANKSIDVIISGSSGSHLGLGLAAAIDRRGYFLTAAHVAADEPLSLVFFDGAQLRALPARVVARLSNSQRDGESKLDVAVLHANAQLDEVFQWASLSDIRPSDLLLQIGRAIHQQSDTNGVVAPAPFVGKHRKTIHLRSGGTAFRTEIPARRGDSGGPVLTLDGKLLGIECGFVKPFLRRGYEIANRPDLNWLAEVIDADSGSRSEPTAASSQNLDSTEPLTITIPLLP